MTAPKTTTAVLAVLTALGTIAAPALAGPSWSAAQKGDVLGDISLAQIDLTHNDRDGAIDRIGRVEAVLTKAGQAGTYRNPAALAAVIRARAELQANDDKSATADLQGAQHDLSGATSG
jgi:hypothetical protein